MPADAAMSRELRFACTQCGACCNRSPEVALSEAATLSDVFVFRLMFRLYDLPRIPAAPDQGFYETKRLLAAFAARQYPLKRKRDGRTTEYIRYLTISALTLDRGSGACAALSGRRCGIYERRPLACRSVPFHYSRPEASAADDLAAFVRTPGYRCDTTAVAPVVIEGGRIVDSGASGARTAAMELAGQDRHWQQMIVRRMKTGVRHDGLPSLREIEASAAFGAVTTSMRVAWRIAAEAGIIGADRCRDLIAAQLAVIDRELIGPECAPSARETLGEMRSEYRLLLNGEERA